MAQVLVYHRRPRRRNVPLSRARVHRHSPLTVKGLVLPRLRSLGLSLELAADVAALLADPTVPASSKRVVREALAVIGVLMRLDLAAVQRSRERLR